MSDKIALLAWTVPSGKWSVRKPFVGLWAIDELQGFAPEFLHLGGPARIKISTRGTGRINFGAFAAELDAKMDDLDERVLRFSFEGSDDGDPACGRGWCMVENGALVGRVFRHFGDEFAFRASRPPEPTARLRAGP